MLINAGPAMAFVMVHRRRQRAERVVVGPGCELADGVRLEGVTLLKGAARRLAAHRLGRIGRVLVARDKDGVLVTRRCRT